MSMQPEDIIKVLGGAASVAAALGLPDGDVGAKRVRAWSARSSIPPEYWAGVVDLAKVRDKPVTLETLARAHGHRVPSDGGGMVGASA